MRERLRVEARDVAYVSASPQLSLVERDVLQPMPFGVEDPREALVPTLSLIGWGIRVAVGIGPRTFATRSEHGPLFSPVREKSARPVICRRGSAVRFAAAVGDVVLCD